MKGGKSETGGQGAASTRGPAQPLDVEQPEQDPTGQAGLASIRPVDLALHGDGVSHWQDEPQPGSDHAGSAKKPARGFPAR